MKKEPKNGLVGFSWAGFNNWEDYKATLSSRDFTDLTRYLEGQVLTIVEASITDTVQREALKSIFRKMLWNEFYYEQVQKTLFQRQKGEDYPLG